MKNIYKKYWNLDVVVLDNERESVILYGFEERL